MSRIFYAIIEYRGDCMKNLKLIRVTKDYTQLKVQMETGISQSILSKYERGDIMPTAENLIMIPAVKKQKPHNLSYVVLGTYSG